MKDDECGGEKEAVLGKSKLERQTERSQNTNRE